MVGATIMRFQELLAKLWVMYSCPNQVGEDPAAHCTNREPKYAADKFYDYHRVKPFLLLSYCLMDVLVPNGNQNANKDPLLPANFARL
jgi:hypothetical protein